MDLQLGLIRIRRGGGSAGHNGIGSIIYELGTPDFVRLRMGVGHPRDTSNKGQHQVIKYVLGDFNGEETIIVKKAIAEADSAIVTLIRDGIERSMNRFNKNNRPKTDQQEPK